MSQGTRAGPPDLGPSAAVRPDGRADKMTNANLSFRSNTRWPFSNGGPAIETGIKKNKHVSSDLAWTELMGQCTQKADFTNSRV